MGEDSKKSKLKKNEYPISPEKTRRCVLTANSPFAAIEAYKAARTNLLFTRTGKGCQKVVLTSSFSGEGKTVNCINLGITLAQNGLRVLIMDADMRRPQIQHIFNIKCHHGLSEVLAGLAAGADIAGEGSVIYRTEHHNLYVLPAGHTPPNPAELLASPQMEMLLKALEAKFDYIIIDSPPVSVVTDAAVLSGLVNGYILVVRQGCTPMEALRGTVMRMEQLKANIIGFILNDADAGGSYKRRGYGRYGRYGKYGRYYKYGYGGGSGYGPGPYAAAAQVPDLEEKK